MTDQEIARIERYLRAVLGCNNLCLLPLADNPDCVEVNIGEEFIGMVFRGEEDGVPNFNFHMPISESDLPVN